MARRPRFDCFQGWTWSFFSETQQGIIFIRIIFHSQIFPKKSVSTTGIYFSSLAPVCDERKNYFQDFCKMTSHLDVNVIFIFSKFEVK